MKVQTPPISIGNAHQTRICYVTQSNPNGRESNKKFLQKMIENNSEDITFCYYGMKNRKRKTCQVTWVKTDKCWLNIYDLNHHKVTNQHTVIISNITAQLHRNFNIILIWHQLMLVFLKIWKFMSYLSHSLSISHTNKLPIILAS